MIRLIGFPLDFNETRKRGGYRRNPLHHARAAAASPQQTRPATGTAQTGLGTGRAMGAC